MKLRRFLLLLGLAACGGSATGPDDEPPADYTVPRALDVLGRDTYLGFSGGLYGHGSNTMPASHRAEALRRLPLIRPRDRNGAPDPAGKVVLLSIGYSNVTQEFCSGGIASCAPHSFTGQALADPAVNHPTLAIANGASGGQPAPTWDDPADANYSRVRDQVLTPMGLSEAQVQVVWIKVANAGPRSSLPAADADAYALFTDWGEILRALRARYPNLQLVFASSRTYGGYATGTLNPEPFAFESGLAVQWVIDAQVRQDASTRAGDVRYGTVPWVGWGPYIWAAGATDPALGWTRADFAADGVHPSSSGVRKVGARLLAFLEESELAQCWFLAGQSCTGGRSFSHAQTRRMRSGLRSLRSPRSCVR